ncbi:hypothetical protein NDU88_004836 [Pleurodeles waltl]|uniref:Uncharacterized protein n=1 Tax=Pleurodeles waltl TaxID=8319 RepID=A0AAV7PGX2_PLEWA|nr:hypothetical protein NDU88_004836 [Pleurodeles waltl]
MHRAQPLAVGACRGQRSFVVPARLGRATASGRGARQGSLSASQPGLPACSVLPATGHTVCCKTSPSVSARSHRPLQPRRLLVVTPQLPLSGPKSNVFGIRELRCAVPSFLGGPW